MRWYMKIYDWMIEDLHLSGNELLVFAYWYSWVESGRECTETATAIAAKLGLKRSSYYYAVEKLVADRIDEVSKMCTPQVSKNCTTGVQKLDTTYIYNT